MLMKISVVKSAGYAVITVQTAWLKFYYPIDFLVATLNSVIDKSDKLKVYIAEASEMGIKVLTPDVNKSKELYSIEGDCIRTGLRALRNLGKMALPIIEERNKNGEFKDIYDYINRLLEVVDKKALESLIYSGALDCFKKTRNTQIKAIPAIKEYINHIKKGLFPEVPFNLPIVDKTYAKLGELEIQDVEEFDELEKLNKEYEYTGMFISGHPLDKYSDILNVKGTLNIDVIIPEEDEESQEERLTSDYDGSIVSIAGIIRNLKQIVTKKGDKMYIFNIEDKTSSIRCVAFPKITKTIEIMLEDDALLFVTGKIQDDDGSIQLIVDSTQELNTLDFTDAKKLFINLSTFETIDKNLIDFIDSNPGNTQVLVKTKYGWVKSKKDINLNWTNYEKLKNQYQIQLGK